MKASVIAIAIAIFVGTGLYYLEEPVTYNGNNNVTANVPEVKKPEQIREISVSIAPSQIIQGEPVMVTVSGTSTIKSLTFKERRVPVFTDNGGLTALIGIDLREKIGTYPLTLTLNDGTVINKNVVVGQRAIVKAPFGIPDKLGGDTPEAEKELATSLIQEANIMNSIPTADQKLWEGEFEFPLKGEVEVTDTYGYTRITGASTFAHKGTDFRADIGTPVYAMNSGTVRYVGFLRNYGNTVVIDHGLGLQTIYMHLSEVSVANGDNVEKGRLLGKSGDTGYVLGPHLHVSIKIDRISIDPMKFMELLSSI